MIRTILFFAITALLCLFGYLIIAVMWVIHFFDPTVYGRVGFRFVRWTCRLGVIVAGARREIKGLENLPEKGQPVVYVLNHRSIFDIITTYPIFPDQTGFVAKKELRKIPAFSQWMLFAHCLFLDRENLREGLKTINQGVSYIQDEGVSMCIFPEGTRCKDNENLTKVQEFKPGAFKLAVKAGVPIVPIAIYNSAAVFEKQFPRMRASDVKITIGTPIPTADLTPEEKKHLSDHVHDILQDMMNEYEKK